MNFIYINQSKYLLENYKEIGLSDIQLIILLNCVDYSQTFVIEYDKLCKITELTALDITKEFADLKEKGLIELTGQKRDMQYVEVVDISNMFKGTSKDSVNVYGKLEMLFGRVFSSVEVNKISKWININKYTIEEIEQAFEVTALQGVKNLNYVEKVLENNQVVLEDEEEVSPLKLDYDWINE